MIKLNNPRLEAMRKIDLSYYGKTRMVPAGRILLVFLANNGRVLESAKVIGINHSRLKNILIDYGCTVGRTRPQGQGALVQPSHIHLLAKSYADQRPDCERVSRLLEEYDAAMATGREWQAKELGRDSVVEPERYEEPTIFLERKDGPPWYSFVEVY